MTAVMLEWLHHSGSTLPVLACPFFRLFYRSGDFRRLPNLALLRPDLLFFSIRDLRYIAVVALLLLYMIMLLTWLNNNN